MATVGVGSSVRRKEDPRLITGKGTYVDDVKLIGMKHMVLVRSHYAHAKLGSIDVSAASKVAGIVAIFTGEQLEEELGSLPCGWVVPDTREVPHPPLAIDTVRYVGDAVVAVIGDTLQSAKEELEYWTEFFQEQKDEKPPHKSWYEHVVDFLTDCKSELVEEKKNK